MLFQLCHLVRLTLFHVILCSQVDVEDDSGCSPLIRLGKQFNLIQFNKMCSKYFF